MDALVITLLRYRSTRANRSIWRWWRLSIARWHTMCRVLFTSSTSSVYGDAEGRRRLPSAVLHRERKSVERAEDWLHNSGNGRDILRLAGWPWATPDAFAGKLPSMATCGESAHLDDAVSNCAPSWQAPKGGHIYNRVHLLILRGTFYC